MVGERHVVHTFEYVPHVEGQVSRLVAVPPGGAGQLHQQVAEQLTDRSGGRLEVRGDVPDALDEWRMSAGVGEERVGVAL
jgi:hypothetical protein